MRKLAFLLVLLNFYSWPGPERGQSAEWEAANRADRDAVIAETPNVGIEAPALRELKPTPRLSSSTKAVAIRLFGGPLM